MTFGEFVKKERMANGWTQRELAEKSLVSTTNIGVIERDKVSPTIYTAEMICRAFGKSFTIGTTKEKPC